MRDLREAIRALRATPVVSLLVVASLALGIGANVGLFSILNAMLLKPLPARSPERLVRVVGGQRTSFPMAVWEQIREHAGFEEALAWQGARLDMAESGPSEFAQGLWLTGDAFEVLGVRPQLGRLLGSEDDLPGGGRDGPVVVISHSLWQSRFGGSDDVVGRTLDLDRVPFRIVGVTPPEFTGLDVGMRSDFALPVAAMHFTGDLAPSSFGPYLQVMGRLAAGDDAATATARLQTVQARIRELTMPGYSRQQDREAYLREPFEVVPAAEAPSFIRRRYQEPLEVLLWLVSLVVVVACGNIANLLLARAASRRHELSVRAALGAGRARLARLLLAESALLATAGTALALPVAAWGSRALVRQLSAWNFTPYLDLSLDLRVLGAAAAVGAGAAVLFGTLPAWRAASADPIEALRSARSAGTGRRRFGAGEGLVVSQIAISLAVVGVAVLLVRSFTNLTTRDLGTDRDAVLVAEPDWGRTSVPPEGRGALVERLRQAIAATPGVSHASASVVLPGGLVKETRVLEIPGDGQEETTVDANEVTPGWFDTVGIHTLAGRDFGELDRRGAPPVAIVNREFANRYLRGREAIGASLVDAWPGAPRRGLSVVGVVGDAVYHSIREPVPPTLYLPLAQAEAVSRLHLCFRGQGGPSPELARSVAAAAAGVDPNLSLGFRTLAEQVEATFARERLTAVLSSALGGLVLLLAALGLYGIVSHTVERRSGEIGIRMAIGATPGSIAGLVLRFALALAGIGISAGVVLTLWATRFVDSLLFGIEPRDPATLGAASALLAVVAIAAGWLPSRRAARLDPMDAIREV